MKILLLLTGKTTQDFVSIGMQEYTKRLQRYAPLEIKVIAERTHAGVVSPILQKQKEAEIQLNTINPNDFVVLLDEQGKELKSIEFAQYIETHGINGTKRLVFIIGGAYGFDECIYNRANYKLSLSKLTYSHQMVRIVFLEQLYRAFTIIKKEPYHHI